ncbi:hypothetical protein D3C73_860800 [compost metagenome]
MELRSPLNGIPSTTYRGSAEAFIDPKPRTRIAALDPGWPDPAVETTPGAAPSNAFVIFVIERFSITSLLTVEAEPVKDDFFAVPYATTITSSSSLLESCKETL